jgi:hypothetical protein
MAIRITNTNRYPVATEEQRNALFGKLRASAGGVGQLTPEEPEEQQFKERAERYQRDAAEFQLAQREAELEQSRRDRQIQENKDRNAAREIANRTYMLDGKPVSGEEMKAVSGRYWQNYRTAPTVTPEQQRATSLQRSLRQFTQNPTQFLLGGGQNVGELFNYLSRANQLFSLTGQEGSFMDSLFGQSRPIPVSSQGNRVGSSMNQATVPNKNMSQEPPRRAYTPGSSFASQGFTREEALGGKPRRAYIPGSSFASQGFTREEALASMNAR